MGYGSERVGAEKLSIGGKKRYSRLIHRTLVQASMVMAIFYTIGVESCKMAEATGPLRPSVSNPRYFTDGSDKPIYLTGSHTWENFQDMRTVDSPTKFDYATFLNLMETHGHNFMRMWVWEQAKWVPWSTKDIDMDPLPYVREGPDLALDNRPKFNLDRFNQGYFDRLRARVIEAGEHGIYVSIMLFNGWSIEKKGLSGNPWKGHPFNKSNNINGIDGDIDGDDEGNELYTLSEDPRSVAALVKQEVYIKKVIDTVNDLDNVLYEVANEARLSSIPWQYRIANMVKSYEATKPHQHPIGITGLHGGGRPVSNATLFDSQAQWISPNNSEPLYMDNPPLNDGDKAIIVDTDHLWGYGGDHTWVWKSFMRGLNPIFMDPWEPLPTSTNPNNHPSLPAWEPLRTAMGDTRRYAEKIDLAAMEPRGDLTTTGYCLANPAKEYLIYLPTNEDSGERGSDRFHLRRSMSWLRQLMGGNQTVGVDLSESSKTFRVEWFNPRTSETFSGGVRKGGSRQSFTAPFSADAVLYLTDDVSDTRP